MPLIHVRCQRGICQRDDENVDYYQCRCRVVLCRPCWEEYAGSKFAPANPTILKAAMAALASTISWECPNCKQVNTQHRLWPLV
jgi:hypothetical protein